MACSSSASSNVPSREDIAAIVAMQDAVVRNLRITGTYHRLSLALGDMLGMEHANWCSFAT